MVPLIVSEWAAWPSYTFGTFLDLQTSASHMRSAHVPALPATLSQAEHSPIQNLSACGWARHPTHRDLQLSLVQRPWEKKDKVDYHVTISAWKHRLPTRLSALMQLAMVRIPRPPDPPARSLSQGVDHG